MFKVDKKGIISGETKKRKSGNYIYDYLTTSSERICNPMRYTGVYIYPLSR